MIKKILWYQKTQTKNTQSKFIESGHNIGFLVSHEYYYLISKLKSYLFLCFKSAFKKN
jgi:hypothetical protein